MRRNTAANIAILLLPFLSLLFSCTKAWERNSPFDPGRGEPTVTPTNTPPLPTHTATPTSTPLIVHNCHSFLTTAGNTFNLFSRHASGTGKFSIDASCRFHSVVLTPQNFVTTNLYTADMFATMSVVAYPVDWQFIGAELRFTQDPATYLYTVSVMFFIACQNGDEFFGDVTSRVSNTQATARVHLGDVDLTPAAANAYTDIRMEPVPITNVGLLLRASDSSSGTSDMIELEMSNLRFF